MENRLVFFRSRGDKGGGSSGSALLERTKGHTEVYESLDELYDEKKDSYSASDETILGPEVIAFISDPTEDELSFDTLLFIYEFVKQPKFAGVIDFEAETMNEKKLINLLADTDYNAEDVFACKAVKTIFHLDDKALKARYKSSFGRVGSLIEQEETLSSEEEKIHADSKKEREGLVKEISKGIWEKAKERPWLSLLVSTGVILGAVWGYRKVKKWLSGEGEKKEGRSWLKWAGGIGLAALLGGSALSMWKKGDTVGKTYEKLKDNGKKLVRKLDRSGASEAHEEGDYRKLAERMVQVIGGDIYPLFTKELDVSRESVELLQDVSLYELSSMIDWTGQKLDVESLRLHVELNDEEKQMLLDDGYKIVNFLLAKKQNKEIKRKMIEAGLQPDVLGLTVAEAVGFLYGSSGIQMGLSAYITVRDKAFEDVMEDPTRLRPVHAPLVGVTRLLERLAGGEKYEKIYNMIEHSVDELSYQKTAIWRRLVRIAKNQKVPLTDIRMMLEWVADKKFGRMEKYWKKLFKTGPMSPENLKFLEKWKVTLTDFYWVEQQAKDMEQVSHFFTESLGIKRLKAVVKNNGDLMAELRMMEETGELPKKFQKLVKAGKKIGPDDVARLGKEFWTESWDFITYTRDQQTLNTDLLKQLKGNLQIHQRVQVTIGQKANWKIMQKMAEHQKQIFSFQEKTMELIRGGSWDEYNTFVKKFGGRAKLYDLLDEVEMLQVRALRASKGGSLRGVVEYLKAMAKLKPVKALQGVARTGLGAVSAIVPTFVIYESFQDAISGGDHRWKAALNELAQLIPIVGPIIFACKDGVLELHWEPDGLHHDWHFAEGGAYVSTGLGLAGAGLENFMLKRMLQKQGVHEISRRFGWRAIKFMYGQPTRFVWNGVKLVCKTPELVTRGLVTLGRKGLQSSGGKKATGALAKRRAARKSASAARRASRRIVRKQAIEKMRKKATKVFMSKVWARIRKLIMKKAGKRALIIGATAATSLIPVIGWADDIIGVGMAAWTLYDMGDIGLEVAKLTKNSFKLKKYLNAEIIDYYPTDASLSQLDRMGINWEDYDTIEDMFSANELLGDLPNLDFEIEAKDGYNQKWEYREGELTKVSFYEKGTMDKIFEEVDMDVFEIAEEDAEKEAKRPKVGEDLELLDEAA